MNVVAARLFPALLLLFAMGLVIESLRMAAADLLYSRAEVEASFWGQKSYVPTSTSVAAAFSDIERARALEAGQPDLMLLHAHMLLWRSYWSQERELSRREEQAAIALMINAAELRPGHRATWERLAREKQRLGQDDAELALAASRVRLLSPAALAP